LNGYIVKHAAAVGMHAPVNSLLHGMIKAKEGSWVTDCEHQTNHSLSEECLPE
jgi:hypothetical protein